MGRTPEVASVDGSMLVAAATDAAGAASTIRRARSTSSRRRSATSPTSRCARCTCSALVDRIAAEDTRNTSQLLARYGISKPSIAVHEHNERSAAERVIEHLRNGERIACVSDAGTPGICDPGAKLVDAVREAGFP